MCARSNIEYLARVLDRISNIEYLACVPDLFFPKIFCASKTTGHSFFAPGPIYFFYWPGPIYEKSVYGCLL